eukprot:COSAG06_NODE_23222_length_699_cov_0.858333_1_plen_153_part_10
MLHTAKSLRHLARTQQLCGHLGTAAPNTSVRAVASSSSTSKPRVLLLGCIGWCSEADNIAMHVALLESKLTCGAVVDSSVLGQPDVAEKLEQAQAVIALEFSADLLDDLSHGAASMALLQVPGAGTDRIDWDSLERYPQIAVCNAAGHEKAMA